jgi:hypothetical protein
MCSAGWPTSIRRAAGCESRSTTTPAPWSFGPSYPTSTPTRTSSCPLPTVCSTSARSGRRRPRRRTRTSTGRSFRYRVVRAQRPPARWGQGGRRHGELQGRHPRDPRPHRRGGGRANREEDPHLPRVTATSPRGATPAASRDREGALGRPGDRRGTFGPTALSDCVARWRRPRSRHQGETNGRHDADDLGGWARDRSKIWYKAARPRARSLDGRRAGISVHEVAGLRAEETHAAEVVTAPADNESPLGLTT